jgi:tetratricopeptide (TPR) repeat protein
VAVVTFVAILFTISARAQNASASSLADQLKTQYKLAKLGADASIAEAGAVLVIHTNGILGVPPGSAATCLATYSDGALHPMSVDDQTHCGKGARKLSAGEKVYAVKIDVDSKKDRVSLLVVGCGSCSGAPQSASSKSQIVFQYPNGYLASAEVDQIEDVINQVISLDIAKSDPDPQPRAAQNATAGLTNDDIIKLVKAKLPDSIIVAKIKSSGCDFVTDADALIKLKQAGVSDAVLQAMVEAPPPTPPTSAENTPEPAAGNQSEPLPSCGNYDACLKIAQSLLESSQWDRSLARFQEASRVDPSKGDAWVGAANAELQLGQYDDAANMWDKALQLGSTLTLSSCHAKALCGDTGTLQLSTKEVSFINKKGEKEFAAAPSEVTSEGAISVNTTPPSYYLQIRYAGKNYRFYYLPKAIRCSLGFICPEPGASQQKVVGDYVHDRLARIAAKDFAPHPNKP